MQSLMQSFIYIHGTHLPQTFYQVKCIFSRPKDHWTLQWKGLNQYSKGRVLKIASFEGSGSLGRLFW